MLFCMTAMPQSLLWTQGFKFDKAPILEDNYVREASSRMYWSCGWYSKVCDRLYFHATMNGRGQVHLHPPKQAISLWQCRGKQLDSAPGPSHLNVRVVQLLEHGGVNMDVWIKEWKRSTIILKAKNKLCCTLKTKWQRRLFDLTVIWHGIQWSQRRRVVVYRWYDKNVVAHYSHFTK
jgi:hypothetical protein